MMIDNDNNDDFDDDDDNNYDDDDDHKVWSRGSNVVRTLSKGSLKRH